MSKILFWVISVIKRNPCHFKTSWDKKKKPTPSPYTRSIPGLHTQTLPTCPPSSDVGLKEKTVVVAPREEEAAAPVETADPEPPAEGNNLPTGSFLTVSVSRSWSALLTESLGFLVEPTTMMDIPQLKKCWFLNHLSCPDWQLSSSTHDVKTWTFSDYHSLIRETVSFNAIYYIILCSSSKTLNSWTC